MGHREESIARLREKEAALRRQLEELDAQTGGKSTDDDRFGQLKEAHRAIRERIDGLEQHDESAWEHIVHEAEQLLVELEDLAVNTARLFH